MKTLNVEKNGLLINTEVLGLFDATRMFVALHDFQEILLTTFYTQQYMPLPSGECGKNSNVQQEKYGDFCGQRY